MIDRVDATIRQASDLGFLRQLPGSTHQWEVRRILKAYVDAQTLSNFGGRLAEYAGATPHRAGGDD